MKSTDAHQEITPIPVPNNNAKKEKKSIKVEHFEDLKAGESDEEEFKKLNKKEVDENPVESMRAQEIASGPRLAPKQNKRKHTLKLNKIKKAAPEDVPGIGKLMEQQR